MLDRHRIGYLVLSLLLFALIVYRAINLSITHDEAYSFLRIVPEGWFNILTYQTVDRLPNNHILNTLGMKFFGGLFDNSEWSLRLPNVLAFLIYIFSFWKLSNFFKSKFSAWTTFILAFGFMYVLEFFSLARGYGLCMAFISLASYQVLAFRQSSNIRNLSLMWLAILLAVLSNFTSFYVVPAFFTVTIWIAWNASKQRLFILISALSGLIILVVLVPPILRLIEANSLFGPKESFFVSTLYSLSWLVLQFGWFIKGFKVLAWIILLSFLFLSMHVLKSFHTEGLRNKSPYQIIWTILALTLLPQLLGNWIFDRHLLMSRTALFMAPIFFTLIGLCLDQLSSKALRKWSSIVTISFIGLNLLPTINLQYASEWYYDKDIKSSYEILREEANQAGLKNATLGITWFMEPGFNYYISRDQQSPFKPVDRSWPKGTYQFHCVFPDDKESLLNQGVEIIHETPNGSTLARARNL